MLKFENLSPITISLGIATYPNDGKTPEDLIRKADAAMYAAKSAGRNQVVDYSRNVRSLKSGDSQAIRN